MESWRAATGRWRPAGAVAGKENLSSLRVGGEGKTLFGVVRCWVAGKVPEITEYELPLRGRQPTHGRGPRPSKRSASCQTNA